MTDFVDEILAKSLATHPFLCQIGGKHPNLKEIYRLLANARGFSAGQGQWYASLIKRIDNPSIQALLASQMNDEFGGDDPSKTHLSLYDELLRGLEQALDADVPEGKMGLAPGQRLTSRAEACYHSPSVYQAIGTVIAAEIRALQFNRWLGEIMQRQNKIDLAQFSWYREHAEMEPHHAKDSERIANMLEAEEKREAAVGARAFDDVLWAFLDEMLAGSPGTIPA